MLIITKIAEIRSTVATVPQSLERECTNFIYVFINCKIFKVSYKNPKQVCLGFLSNFFSDYYLTANAFSINDAPAGTLSENSLNDVFLAISTQSL
jgi:hypothetical protein